MEIGRDYIGETLREKVLQEQLLPQKISGKILLSLILLNFVSISRIFGQDKIAKVYQVEAAFLYNFTRFVNWPPDAAPSDQTPFVIGILGQDPFQGYLDEIVKGEMVNGRPIQIKRYDELNKVGECAILFINLREPEEIKQALAKFRKQGILTVADSPDFARRGGVIEFFIEENKVRIKINVDAAKAQGLEISSKLLSLAKIY